MVTIGLGGSQKTPIHIPTPLAIFGLVLLIGGILAFGVTVVAPLLQSANASSATTETIAPAITDPQTANTAPQTQQNAPVAPSLPGNPGLPRINGSVPVLDAVGVSNPPANSAAPATTQNNYAEFAAENAALQGLIIGQKWMPAYVQSHANPDLIARKVLDQRFALHKQSLRGFDPNKLTLKQTGSQITQGSKIGTYEVSGWFMGNWKTKEPAGNKFATTLTVTFTNGKITNLAFR